MKSKRAMRREFVRKNTEQFYQNYKKNYIMMTQQRQKGKERVVVIDSNETGSIWSLTEIKRFINNG